MQPCFRMLLAVALACGLAASAEVPSAKAEVPSTLGGFDLELALSEVSGLVFAPGAYENQLGLTLSPSYALGQRLWAGTFAESLTLAAELVLESELSGNDPRFRATSFATAALFRDSPERLPLLSYGVDGLNRQGLLSDLTLALTGAELATLPWQLGLGASVRVVLPTSSSSRNRGLWAAPSASVQLEKKLSRLTLSWSLGGTVYLFSSASAQIARNPEPVEVNGLLVEPYQPPSGAPNPSHGLSNVLSAAVELPREFSVSAQYALMHTWAHALSGCEVPGVPTADVCRDGALVGTVQKGLGQSDEHAFTLEVGVRPFGWGAFALGLSTYRPVRAPDGSIANPFLQLNRDNYSTVYLSFSVSAVQLLAAKVLPSSQR